MIINKPKRVLFQKPSSEPFQTQRTVESFMEIFINEWLPNASDCHEGGRTKPSTITSAMAKKDFMMIS